jgi:hypothetical protein
MNKVFGRVHSEAVEALGREVAASIASLYEVEVVNGRRLRPAKINLGEEAAQRETEKTDA